MNQHREKVRLDLLSEILESCKRASTALQDVAGSVTGLASLTAADSGERMGDIREKLDREVSQSTGEDGLPLVITRGDCYVLMAAARIRQVKDCSIQEALAEAAAEHSKSGPIAADGYILTHYFKGGPF